MRRTVLLAFLVALLVPAAAVARTPAATTPPAAHADPCTGPCDGDAPQRKPATGRIGLRMVHGPVIAGQRFRFGGRLHARRHGHRVRVAGQWVVLRVLRNGHQVETMARKVGRHGRFRAHYTSSDPGIVKVVAVHRHSRAVRRARGAPRRIQVVGDSARPGERSPAVRWLQSKLAHHHYAVPRSGVLDAGTERAVLAFRKMTGMARTTTADAAVFHALAAGRGDFPVRYRSHGRHVEGDLTHQVLALIDAGGKVVRLFPMSSGKPSTPTILGHFRVYLKTPGTNSEGMVDSNYFIRGYAIHGYAYVPTYPASHGCLRLPIPYAASVYGWVHIGTPVDVYYR